MFRHLLVLLLVLLLTGCSKLTMDNYQQLKVGMAFDEVTGIIGNPDSCSEKLGTRNCVWGDEEAKHIKVSFIKEAAVLFSHKELN